MKRLSSIFLLVLTGSITSHGIAVECHPDVLAQTSIQRLPKEFNFLKSYQIDNGNGGKQTVEYSYVFTRGTNYALSLCTNSNKERILFSVYDFSRNLIAQNVVKNSVVDIVTISCQATGIYYMKYTFPDTLKHCGGSALGFRRL